MRSDATPPRRQLLIVKRPKGSQQILLIKALVKGYTRKDGVFVMPHEDSRASAKHVFHVFHGTDKEFKDFDPAHLGANFSDNSSRHGFFFTDNKSFASIYGNRVVGAQVHLDNPKVIDVEALLRDDYAIAKQGGDGPDSFEDYVRDNLEGEPYAYYEQGMLNTDILDAKGAGHDGLVLDFGNLRSADHGALGRTVIPFSHQAIRQS